MKRAEKIRCDREQPQRSRTESDPPSMLEDSLAQHQREPLKALPSRPEGRTSSISTRIRNIMALGNAGPMNCDVKVLIRPSSSPPISAPAGLPTPPSVTTTK